MDFVELKCSTSKESGAGDAKDGIKKNDSPISSRSMSPDETRKKDRFDSINYQNEAYDRVEQEDQVDSDNSDDVPLRRKEQAEKDMSDDFKPKKESRKYLEYYAKQYHLPLPPRNRADSTGDEGFERKFFQQININGEETTGLNQKQFTPIAKEIVNAMEMRQRYMKTSHQSMGPTGDRHIRIARVRSKSPQQEEMQMSMDVPYHPPPEHMGQTSPYSDLKETELPQGRDWSWKMRHGIIDVKDEENNPIRFVCRPDTLEFLDNHAHLLSLMSQGTLRTYCWRRLQFLSHKFHLHALLNENLEVREQKELPHRDFYNCRKVDNHIHAAACMNQKHLLRFIKKSLKNDADIVCRSVDGKGETLKDVFDQMNINAYDLSVDLLDCHADSNVYHRFDKFNSKYNPLGQSVLRELYIKTDNYMNGKYFADIIKQVGDDLEESKYQHAEPRLSIYGRNYGEFEKLAKWAVSNDVYSSHLVWLIQIPRIFDIYKKNAQMSSFQELLRNVFGPVMDATLNPQLYPELSRFLENVVGFDSVDDESKAETFNFTAESATPDKYTANENPPYSYYLWYMYANITVINQIRSEMGLNTFTLRPHCGEGKLV
jgi:AMP deaminase